MKTRSEVREQVREVADALAEERGFTPGTVTDADLDAAYDRLWAWDKNAVEEYANCADVRQALVFAAARRATLPEDPDMIGECPF
jgi:hypothetical protein